MKHKPTGIKALTRKQAKERRLRQAEEFEAARNRSLYSDVIRNTAQQIIQRPVI